MVRSQELPMLQWAVFTGQPEVKNHLHRLMRLSGPFSQALTSQVLVVVLQLVLSHLHHRYHQTLAFSKQLGLV